MPIVVVDNFDVNVGKNMDSRFGPYASTGQAITAISSIFRYKGLTVLITGSGQNLEYWFNPGIADADLVPKTAAVETGSFVTTSSFNSWTGSGTFGGTASLAVITASLSGNDLTFTKGNGNQFTLVIPGVGGPGGQGIELELQGNNLLLTSASSTLSTVQIYPASSSILANTASFVTASNVWGPYGSSSVVSASHAVTASYISGSFRLTAGGSNTHIQFNSASVFSGSTNLAFDYVNNNVILTGSLLVTKSHISTVDYIDFTKIPTGSEPAHLEGRLHWYDDTKTLQIDTDKNNFMIEVGHQNVVRVYNDTGADIGLGKVVRISGSQGNQPKIVTASWIDDSSSASTLGFAATLIAGSGGNRHGYVVTNGILRNANTSAHTVGTQLYLSTSGDFTNIPPDAPLHEVRLGKVIVQNSTTGVIYVDVMNGYELTELHDVKTTTYNAGDLLIQSGGLWINSKQLTGSYGLTGSFNVSGAISASFGPNTVGFYGTASWAVTASNVTTASFALTASAAPSDTYIQYNTGGFFGAEQYFAYIYNSHSFEQGISVIASGPYSHAQGMGNIAWGSHSHAEGRGNQAYGSGSHAEGRNNFASASYSHVGGLQNTGSGIYQTVVGQNSVESLSQSAFIVGGGWSTDERVNAFVVIPETRTGNFQSDSIIEMLAQTASISSSHLYVTVSSSYLHLRGLLTESQASNVLTYDFNTKRVYYTASSALGGGTSNPPTSPGGSNQQIQFNSASVFSGSANLTFNYDTNVINLTGAISASAGPNTVGFYGTASWAVTASHAITSSYVLSASYATSASYVLSSSYATTASFVTSASYATSASYVLSSSYADTASFVTSASYATSASQALSASYVLSSSYATSASYVLSASYADTASAILVVNTNDTVPDGDESLHLVLAYTGSETGVKELQVDTGLRYKPLNNFLYIPSNGALIIGNTTFQSTEATFGSADAQNNVVYLTGSLNVSKSINVDGRVQISGSLSTTGSVYHLGLNTSPTVTDILTYNPSTGEVFYTASSAIGGGSSGPPGTPGGLDSQIQFNSGSQLSGSANFTFYYSGSINAVQLTGSLLVSGAISAAPYDTYVQFNSGGLLHGTSSLTYNYSQSILVLTGSLVVTQNITSSRALISSSGGNQLTVMGSGSSAAIAQVFGSQGNLITISDSLSGSLLTVSDISGYPILDVVSDESVLIGNYQAPARYTSAKITTINGINTVYSMLTSSYNGAFFDYTLVQSTNARAGQIMSIWNGSTIRYTETTTTDIGSTSDFAFSVALGGGSASLRCTTTTAGATIKTIIKNI